MCSSHCRPGGWRSGEWGTPAHPQGRVPPSLGSTELLWLLLGSHHPLLVRLGPAGPERSPCRERGWRPAQGARALQGQCAACRGPALRVSDAEPEASAQVLRAGQGWGGEGGGLQGTHAPRSLRRGILKAAGPWQARGVTVWVGGPKPVGLSDAPPSLARVPSPSGPLCLWPLPPRGLVLQHAGPRVTPLHLPCGLHRPGLWYR